MRHLKVAALVLIASASIAVAALAATPLAVGRSAPPLTYHLLSGKQLSPKALRGHPYVLWAVASWCSSCETGSKVVGDHIGMLRSHGVRIVELQLFKDLGAPGPGLGTFQKAVGMNATSPNWYWGELTQAQTMMLDPSGAPDIYYLVDENGTIAAISGNPATTWDAIARFATSAPQAKHR